MKMSKMTSLILIVMAIGIVSCTNSGTSNKGTKHAGVEYYRSLQFSETPYDIEKGTHPLTPDEAKNINSYKFTYDNDGKLLSVEYVRNNVLLGNSSLGAAKIEYKYDGNMQTKYFFNKDNQPVESGGVFAFQYALDSKGDRVGLMYLSKDGAMIENRNKIHSWHWEKLPDGMVRELRYNLAGEEVVMNPFCPFYELRFSYNDKGYVVKMANYKADTLYNCTAENCGDVGVSYFSFTPNESGDVERFEVFNVFGQMSNLYWGWSKRISKYDANGYVTETLYYDQDNEVVSGKLVPLTKYSYDEHGALIETVNCDKDGNKINSPDNGVSVTKYSYDDAGQRIGTAYFDKDNVEVKLQ
jgi:YD repeat-containing protein